MMCSNGSAAFGVPAGTDESGSEFGPRVPEETLPEGKVAAALLEGLGLGVAVTPGAADDVAPGAGVDPVPVPVPFVEPAPGTGEPPTAAPPLHAASPNVAAPADLRIKPLRVTRKRDMKIFLFDQRDAWQGIRRLLVVWGNRALCLVNYAATYGYFKALFDYA